MNLRYDVVYRLWEKKEKIREKRGGAWCKHLLITFCRIDTHILYETEAAGDDTM